MPAELLSITKPAIPMYLSCYFLTAVLTFCCFTTTLAQNDNDKMVIEGELRNIPEPVSYIYFIYSGNNNTDSTPVVRNKYTYELKSTDRPCFMTMFIRSPKNPESYKDRYMRVLILDGTNVSITSIDSFSNIRVQGSEAYNEYVKLEKLRLPYSKEKMLLLAEQKTNKEKGDKEAVNLLDARIDSLSQRMAEQFLTYAGTNPHSPAMIYALSQTLSFAADKEKVEPEVRRLYETLSEKEKNSTYGKGIKARAYDETLAIGKTAPAFELPDTANKLVPLESYKGKYVLLDFWASWCTPCRAEHPYLLEALERYHNKNFTILSVTIDLPEDRDKWLAAIKKDKLSWTQLMDKDSKIRKKYRVTSIPKNFLLDPQGRIIDKNLRGPKLEKALEKLFEKK
ncbi:MAG: AhpC/TSA family protein [Chitinophagaceae bacterium]|nr:AhpC/TSA family protein [Chitinophagaceae bacterium]